MTEVTNLGFDRELVHGEWPAYLDSIPKEIHFDPTPAALYPRPRGDGSKQVLSSRETASHIARSLPRYLGDRSRAVLDHLESGASIVMRKYGTTWTLVYGNNTDHLDSLPQYYAFNLPLGTGLLFPGQGVQKQGMGYELSKYKDGRLVLEQADDILASNLSLKMTEGSQDLLNETVNTQLAVFVYGVAAYRIMLSESDVRPGLVAGHSLGLLASMVVAGAIDFSRGLKLVKARGEAMALAGQKMPGSMAAILGLENGVVERIAQENGVHVTGYNSPTQTIIGGKEDNVKVAISQVPKPKGRVVPLAVGVVAHSAHMESAREKMTQAVAEARIDQPHRLIISDNGELLVNPGAIAGALVEQLTRPVDWRATSLMLKAWATDLVELGPDLTVGNLTGRNVSGIRTISYKETLKSQPSRIG